MRQAACALVYCSTTRRIIAVSRKNSDRLSLPGGKVDPDETTDQCVIREVREETGITLSFDKCINSYSQIDDDSYLVQTFIFIVEEEMPFVPPYEEIMKPQWMTVEAFRERTIYLQYNDRVLSMLYDHIGQNS